MTKRTSIRCQCGTRYTLIMRVGRTCCAGCQMNLCDAHKSRVLLKKGHEDKLADVPGPWHEPGFSEEDKHDEAQDSEVGASLPEAPEAR